MRDLKHWVLDIVRSVEIHVGGDNRWIQVRFLMRLKA